MASPLAKAACALVVLSSLTEPASAQDKRKRAVPAARAESTKAAPASTAAGPTVSPAPASPAPASPVPASPPPPVDANGSPASAAATSVLERPERPSSPPPRAPTDVDEADLSGIKDPGPHERPWTATALVEMPWWHGIGIGVGGRLEIPVLKNGPIPKLNNQISVEPSFTLGYYRAYRSYLIEEEHLGVLYFAPMVYGLWSFHFSERLRAYGGFGVGASIGVPRSESRYVDVSSESYFRFDPVVGVFYSVAERLSVRGELGGWGPKFGAAFAF